MQKRSVVAFATMTLAALLATFLLAGAAPANTYIWTGSSSTVWGTKSNWSPTTVPTLTDEADFTGTFTNQPSLAQPQALARSTP